MVGAAASTILFPDIIGVVMNTADPGVGNDVESPDGMSNTKTGPAPKFPATRLASIEMLALLIAIPVSVKSPRTDLIGSSAVSETPSNKVVRTTTFHLRRKILDSPEICRIGLEEQKWLKNFQSGVWV